MKKILLFIVAALLFTACSKATPQTSVSPSTDNFLDNQILTDALNSENPERCTEIADQSLKTECEASIAALKTTEKAVQKSDKKLCNTITIDRFKTNCLSKVDAKIADDNKLQDLLKEDQKRLKISQKAYDKGDYKLCEQIADENQRETCKFNVITKLAADKNKPELCESLSTEEDIMTCKQSLK